MAKFKYKQDSNTSTCPVPVSSYWFPEDLLAWDPQTDYNAPFNVVRVPIAKRSVNTATQLNPQQGSLLQVQGSFGQVTSNQPSQGTSGSGAQTVFSFPFWQYLDFYQYWAGSAGEGLIVPPAPYWVTAGHRNGVKVLGVVFFPPNAFGGQIEWVNQFLTKKSDGSFPVADKLIQVARTYGFDGWFINQETSGGTSATGTSMQEFMEYYQNTKPAGLELVWYDAMIPNGTIWYQNELNSTNAFFFQDGQQRVADQFFANYGWDQSMAQSSAEEAKSLGRSQYDVQMGINLPSGQFNYQQQMNSLVPHVDQAPITSVALFGAKSATFDDKDSFEQNYQLALDFWTAGYNWFLGSAGNNWSGTGYYTPARTAITDSVFLSRFNVGQGTDYYICGQSQGFGNWWDVGQQDILPTWAGLNVTSGSGITASYDRSNAYNGGSCLYLSGNSGSPGNATIYLYKTEIPASSGSELTVTWYANLGVQASQFTVILLSQDSSGNINSSNYPVSNSTQAGWNTQTFDLSGLAGQNIVELRLLVNAAANQQVDIRIGEIGIRDTQFPTPNAVSGFKVAQQYIYNSDQSANLNLSWEQPADFENTWYFDILRQEQTGTTFLGRTSNTIYNLQAIPRNSDTTTTFIIYQVNLNGDTGPQSTVTLNW